MSGMSDEYRSRCEQTVLACVELAAEALHVLAEHGRDLADERPVAREPVVQRRADELLADLPVRVRRRLPCERRPQDRAGDVLEAARGQHLRDVHALRERELLVGVAEAVAPGQAEVLDEQGALGVHHPPLRDDERRALCEAPLPVGDERSVSLGPAPAPDERRCVTGDRPGDVDGADAPRPDREAHRSRRAGEADADRVSRGTRVDDEAGRGWRGRRRRRARRTTPAGSARRPRRCTSSAGSAGSRRRGSTSAVRGRSRSARRRRDPRAASLRRRRPGADRICPPSATCNAAAVAPPAPVGCENAR